MITRRTAVSTLGVLAAGAALPAEAGIEWFSEPNSAGYHGQYKGWRIVGPSPSLVLSHDLSEARFQVHILASRGDRRRNVVERLSSGDLVHVKDSVPLSVARFQYLNNKTANGLDDLRDTPEFLEIKDKLIAYLVRQVDGEIKARGL